MHYFAFGSNLEPERMTRRCPGHQVVGMAALHDHRLAFPRVSEDWSGGVASVQPAHGETVWGVVYELTDDDVARLDRYEGFREPGSEHNAYEREWVYVELTRPDDGSVPRRVRACVYVARPGNSAAPSQRYLEAILRGARHHRLPDDWIAAIESVPAGDG